MVLVVEIEDQSSPKPFLGGWRDVVRDIEYHDACSQTPAELLHGKRRRLVDRPAQTSAWVDRRSRAVSVSGAVERAVQVVPEIFPVVGERIVVARSEEEVERRLEAAVKIQRFYREYRRRQLSVADGKDNDEEEEEDGNDDLDEDRSAFVDDSPDYRSTSRSLGEFHIVSPEDRGPGDLTLLRNLLDRWGCAEEAKIRVAHAGDDRENLSARRAAQSDRLEREIEILRAIDTARSDVCRRRNERTRSNFLDELSKPVDIGGSEKLSRVRVETLSVQCAREFRDTYDRLLLDEDDDVEDEFARIELLFSLKKIASQHTCSASSNLENLIDQELFLLSSRVRTQGLKHLRSRIKLGFLRLARGALRHDASAMRSGRTRLCPSCGRLKRLETFEVDHRERLSRTCVDCAALRTRRAAPTAHHSADLYEKMLKELRRSEAARPDGASSLAFAMGPKAIGYLVNDIWHGRSAISECQDLEQLRLVRLEPAVAWSPWNTLLATRREARMHEALAREEDAYDVELRRKFRRMNLQARLYFEALAKPRMSGLSL